MTRKDFILLAGIIRDLDLRMCSTTLTGKQPSTIQREMIAEEFAEALKQTNPQFKPELFIQAATGECPLNARRVR